MDSVLWRENTSFVFSTDRLSKGDVAPRIWGYRPDQQEDGSKAAGRLPVKEEVRCGSWLWDLIPGLDILGYVSYPFMNQQTMVPGMLCAFDRWMVLLTSFYRQRAQGSGKEAPVPPILPRSAVALVPAAHPVVHLPICSQRPWPLSL